MLISTKHLRNLAVLLHRELEILFLACRNSFSSIGLDQRHEQQTKDVIVDGGFLEVLDSVWNRSRMRCF